MKLVVGKKYKITQKGLDGRKGTRTQTGEVVAEYEKFYLVKTEKYKITILKSEIKSGQCKFEEINQVAS